MKTKGFTLVELLVVIAILAILATVSVVSLTSSIDTANNSVALQEVTQVRTNAQTYDLTKGNKDGVVSGAEALAAAEEVNADAVVALGTLTGSDDLVLEYALDNGKAYYNIATGEVFNNNDENVTFTAHTCDYTATADCTVCGAKKPADSN